MFCIFTSKMYNKVYSGMYFIVGNNKQQQTQLDTDHQTVVVAVSTGFYGSLRSLRVFTHCFCGTAKVFVALVCL